ncbi:hypothetical protein J1605_021612 [Eschrichtius robustus]|uniref:Uncharacterized protein n=1 Tax=Eschrichtius robustus TaxID=9764 RepID=A0AB34HEK0_ESCRO|nr:hypothetical protein J1605_021612 [Eschrichtius robustus]
MARALGRGVPSSSDCFLLPPARLGPRLSSPGQPSRRWLPDPPGPRRLEELKALGLLQHAQTGLRGVVMSAEEYLSRGFPGGAVVESLPANAGDTGSSPGLGRSHMPRSDWAREPQLLRLRVWSLCSATREAAIVRGPRTAVKSGPRLPQLEKALAQKRRPNTAKNK